MNVLQNDEVMDMEDLGAEIIDPKEVETTAVGGKWDYEGLANALKSIFPKPKAGEVKAARVLVEKVLKYHSTGELKNPAHYAKKAIEKAIRLNGWKPKIVRTEAGKYVKFVVEF